MRTRQPDDERRRPSQEAIASYTGKHLGERLVEQEFITQRDLQAALEAQKERGGRLGEVLIELGCLTASEFTHFLARQPGVVSIELSSYAIPHEIIQLVPREFAVEHEIFPIDRIKDRLTVGMVCPLDNKAIEELEALTSCTVRPVLCSAFDIRAAIEQFYPAPETTGPSESAPQPSSEMAESVMRRLDGMARLVRNVDSLPALPETARRVGELMKNPEVRVEDLAGIIAMDPPMAAKLLSVANSAEYGFANRVDDIRLAVSLLGLRETHQLVMSVAVMDHFDQHKNREYKRLWTHAMCCAGASRIVAASTKSRVRSVFCAGLLHDLGRFAMLEIYPAEYREVNQKLDGLALLELEENVFGLSHTEAGYELAEHWALPTEIASAIRFHHQPQLAQEARELVAIISLGHVIAGAPGGDPEACLYVFDEVAPALEILEIDRRQAVNIVRRYLDLRDDRLRDV